MKKIGCTVLIRLIINKFKFYEKLTVTKVIQ